MTQLSRRESDVWPSVAWSVLHLHWDLAVWRQRSPLVWGGQWLTARSTARRERVGRLETAPSEPYLTYLNALTELAVGGSDSRELALKLNSVTNQIKLVAGLAGS